MKRGASVAKWLRPLNECTTQAYLTNELQVADVLEWILEQVGESEVWQSTFSISEEFLRRLYFLRKKQGKIRKLTIMLDRKATQKTISLWPFIRQVVQDAYLADNHSKILLVKSVSGKVVSVITSQNLTRGNRYEASFVSVEPVVFDTLNEQIKQIITYHSIPIYDLYRRAIEANSTDGLGLHDAEGDCFDS